MIESTLQFDDIEDIPGLLPLLWEVQRSCMRSREQSGDGLGTRLGLYMVKQLRNHSQFALLQQCNTASSDHHTYRLILITPILETVEGIVVNKVHM